MANARMKGFRPVDGAAWLIPGWYNVADDYNAALAVGDPVALASDGSITRCTSGNDSDAASKVFGIIAGCEYGSGADRKEANVIPASTSYSGGAYGHDVSRVRVYAARPGIDMFEISGTAADIASHDTLAELQGIIGNNADHDASTPDLTHKWSAVQLDISTIATTTAQWRIVQTSPGEVGQSQLATYARFIVTANESWWPGSTKTGT